MRQCQLDADRTAAEDDETAREIPAARRSSRWSARRQGRDRGSAAKGGARSSGHDEPARSDPFRTDRDRAVVEKRSAVPRSTVTAETLETGATESCGASVAITAWDTILDAAEVDRGLACPRDPGIDADMPACRRLATASKAFDGTQPVFRHSPPMAPRSISTVSSPSREVPAATDSPADPAPMTQTSQRRGVKARAPIAAGWREPSSSVSPRSAEATTRPGPGATRPHRATADRRGSSSCRAAARRCCR